jgi:hypothetical protein
MSQDHGEHLADLLHADRELSDEEMKRLRLASKHEWATMLDMLRAKAHAAYDVAHPAQFERCVTRHMTPKDWEAMVVAGVFECPQCSRLLKVRNSSVVATAVLLERSRISGLWDAVERASPEHLDARMQVFRRALDLL